MFFLTNCSSRILLEHMPKLSLKGSNSLAQMKYDMMIWLTKPLICNICLSVAGELFFSDLSHFSPSYNISKLHSDNVALFFSQVAKGKQRKAPGVCPGSSLTSTQRVLYFILCVT